MFDEYTVPPKFLSIHRGFTKSIADPYKVGKYAKLWRGQFNSGEVDNRATDACLKAIKIEKVHEVIAFALDQGNMWTNIL